MALDCPIPAWKSPVRMASGDDIFAMSCFVARAAKGHCALQGFASFFRKEDASFLKERSQELLEF
jgi:hypothetical protein